MEGCALLPELVDQVAAAAAGALVCAAPLRFSGTITPNAVSSRKSCRSVATRSRRGPTGWDRDEQFGREVAAAATERGFTVEWVDGSRSIEELTALAAAHFGLEELTMSKITLLVNGVEHDVDVPAAMPLLWVLRDVLNLTGTKFSCGEGQCGACTVHIDGEARRSCVTPVSKAAGHAITTIEGLSADRRSPACRRAWLEEQVVQCGYCQAGQIMAAAALLAKNSAAERRRDRRGHGRCPLPLRQRTSASAVPSTVPLICRELEA